MLGELGLPYEVVVIPLTDVKKPEYLAINPNGRIPAIYDPNTGITLWESGAILEYLVEQYDKSHRLSFVVGTTESYHAKQWLFFQASGQGPYYGQAAWFKKYHPERVPSAVERYIKEINRVSGVLDSHLARQEKEFVKGDGPWLVGNKMSFADIAFLPYQSIISKVVERGEYDVDNYPQVKEWLGKMTSREAVRKALELDPRLAN